MAVEVINPKLASEYPEGRIPDSAVAIYIRAIHEALQRCPERYSHVIRPVDLTSEQEVRAIVALVQRNFREHPHYKIPETEGNSPLNEQVIAKYLEANCFENLLESMSEINAFPFVLEQNGEILGFILCKVKNGKLKINRLHTSIMAAEKGVLGAGRALLNMAVIAAKELGIRELTSTASYPARGYFEHMGWVGQLEQNAFPYGENQSVILTQFNCSFELTDDFEGF